MYSQDTTGRILRQLVDGAPQARDVEIALVKSDHEQIGFLPA
jgi:hypothetical protein